MGAVTVSYNAFDLPADARLWGTLAFSAIALGLMLIGGTLLFVARAKDGR